MSTVDGGELVARTLAGAGVRHAFGVHGGHLDSMLTAMVRHGIAIVDMRHEAAAGNAADGYARATGGLGVAFATAGPGFANVFAALANAHADRVPVLVLTSSPPLREIELNVLQGGIDQVAAAAPVTRWAHRVTTAARIPDLVALAIRHATAGVPGPVLLELPIDVLFRPLDDATVEPPGRTEVEVPGPSARAVDGAIELLRAAKRPVIVVGGGASLSAGTRDALVALLESATIPVVAASWGHGVLPPDHPCLLGGVGELAALPFLANEPDLVVLLGARRGLFLGGRGPSMVPEAARVVQVDVDGVETGRVGRCDLAVRSDVAEFVRAVAGRDVAWPDWDAWNASTKAARGPHGLLFADASPVTASGRIHPYFAARGVAAVAASHDAVVVYDGGEASGWINFFAGANQPRSWFGIGYMGGLGVGPGLSIGAQVARPDRRVVAVTGDGAIGFHLSELDTMVRHGLPITTVVFNNLGWVMSRHGQQALYGEGPGVAVDLPDTRYDRVAEAFGLYGERVDVPDEVGPALERALASGRPACVDVAVAPEIVHPMMAGLSERISDGATRIPYYEAVPRGEI